MENLLTEEQYQQLLPDARKALVERNFEHFSDLILLRHINPDLTRIETSYIATFLIAEIYNDAKYNEVMTDFATQCVNTLTVDLFVRYHELITQSVFTRAIEFDNEQLFNLLKRFNIAYYMNTSVGVYQAIDRCPNPQMIQNCFFGNFLDMRYPGDCNFFAKEAPEFVNLVHTLRVVENLEQQQLTLVQRLAFINIPGRVIPPGTFSRAALMQHFLERALHHRNRPVCHYLLQHGIRPTVAPESRFAMQFIARYDNPSYQFSRDDYMIFVESTQKEIRTLVTLAQNSETLMNVLPNELQDLIIDQIL